MGVWGAGIFSDDDAADVRDRYRELLGDGYEGNAATDIILREWQDDSQNTALWLALAAVQWRHGRLEERIKNRALQIIGDGADLDRWKHLGGTATDIKKRNAVLQHLRAQLLGPSRAKENVAKQYRGDCDWQRGELIGYTLLSGKTIIFRVLGLRSDRGGSWPVCEVLDFVGDSIPPATQLENLPILQCLDPKLYPRPQIAIGRASAREYPQQRITQLGIKLRPSQELAWPHTFVLWRFLDSALAQMFGLK